MSAASDRHRCRGSPRPSPLQRHRSVPSSNPRSQGPPDPLRRRRAIRLPPVRESEAEGRTALGAVVKTFFGGSLTHVVSALLDERKDRLSPEELSELERIVREAKESGR
ncbi:hypothetical protein U1Q18_052114 [Sarracenia purpurea var. burkii]